MSTLQMKSSGVHIQPVLDVEIGIGGRRLGLAIRHGHPRPIPWSCRHATRCFSGRFSRASTTETKPTFSVHGGGKGAITRGLRGKGGRGHAAGIELCRCGSRRITNGRSYFGA